jgi:hypothetical protein
MMCNSSLVDAVVEFLDEAGFFVVGRLLLRRVDTVTNIFAFLRNGMSVSYKSRAEQHPIDVKQSVSDSRCCVCSCLGQLFYLNW